MAADMRRLQTSWPDLARATFEWHTPAWVAATAEYGLEPTDVLSVARFPEHVELDNPKRNTLGGVDRTWIVERRQRAGVTVVVTYPDDSLHPRIWAVYKESV